MDEYALVVNVDAVVTRGDEYLVIERSAEEEVGVEVGAVEYVSGYTFVADEGTPCLNVVTRCEYESGEPRVREPEEVASVFWVTFDELESRDDVSGFTLAFARQVAEH